MTMLCVVVAMLSVAGVCGSANGGVGGGGDEEAFDRAGVLACRVLCLLRPLLFFSFLDWPRACVHACTLKSSPGRRGKREAMESTTLYVLLYHLCKTTLGRLFSATKQNNNT